MTVAIAILGGAAMVLIIISLFFVLLGFLGEDMGIFGLLGCGISLILAWIFLIPVYVLAISIGASLWTIIVGGLAMASPIFMLLVQFAGIWPLFFLIYVSQIALFVLALLKV